MRPDTYQVYPWCFAHIRKIRERAMQLLDVEIVTLEEMQPDELTTREQEVYDEYRAIHEELGQVASDGLISDMLRKHNDIIHHLFRNHDVNCYSEGLEKRKRVV